MKDADLSKLFKTLYLADTEDAVDTVIKQYTEIFSQENWFPLGGNQSNFGVIENFGHLKISNSSNIYKYSNSKKFDLVYEMINETTIGKANLNVLNTSWDYGYHLLYDTKSSYTNVAGSIRISEADTFINNIINLPSEVNVSEFNSELVDDLSKVNMDTKEIVYNITNGKISGIINIKNVFISKLRNIGMNKCFNMLIDSNIYLGNLTLDDYINSYIETNTLPLYTVSGVDVYKKIQKNNTKFSITSYDVGLMDNLGFINTKDISINNSGKYMVTFTYGLNLQNNIELNFNVILKLT